MEAAPTTGIDNGYCPVLNNTEKQLQEKTPASPFLKNKYARGALRLSIIQMGQLRIRLLRTYEGVLAVNESPVAY